MNCSDEYNNEKNNIDNWTSTKTQCVTIIMEEKIEVEEKRKTA